MLEDNISLDELHINCGEPKVWGGVVNLAMWETFPVILIVVDYFDDVMV